ncbi:radial spoke head 14 homolog [Pygocentrus nattereri]|uniref:Radial spoke head 14 homolog n=1 Tax=Pygocentrus nattereri TaxID=42514 RepID=A0A3B4DXE9_PYGNA|nr:radial spoke head 14 homolog [Pygocentrus nattereri]
MAGTRISERLPPILDRAQAPVAFGQRALPRLAAELQNGERSVRQRALAALRDLIHDPERAYEAIHHGCLERLRVLLKDENASVRTTTAEVLHLLATHSVGREAFLRLDVVSSLAELLDEPVDACRKNVHQALKMMAELPAAVVCMVSLGLVPRLVMKVAVEPLDIRELVLSTLSCCVRVDALSTLASDGVSVLKEQLAHASTNIRRAAASAMMAISVPPEGKVKICEEEVLPVVVQLLNDADPGVSAKAAGIIMYTAVITRGKFQALEAGVLPPLLCLVESEDRAVCVNTLRALTCLAEAPKARAQLLQHLPLLQTRLQHPEPIIQRAAATAIQVISWTP